MQPTSEPLSFSAGAVKIKLSSSVRDAVSQDGAILLDVENGSCMSLNVVGAKIWQMLKQEWGGDRIVAALEQEFLAVPTSHCDRTTWIS